MLIIQTGLTINQQHHKKNLYLVVDFVFYINIIIAELMTFSW